MLEIFLIVVGFLKELNLKKLKKLIKLKTFENNGRPN